MTTRESVCPSPVGQISYYHVLAVGRVLVGLSAVAGIETDLKSEKYGKVHTCLWAFWGGCSGSEWKVQLNRCI